MITHILLHFQTCFNTARGNAVDVCCRDPNYKDPWPDMDRSGAGQASAPAPASQFQVIDNSPTQALEQHLAAQKNNQQKQIQNNKNRRPGYGKWDSIPFYTVYKYLVWYLSI